MNNKYLPPNLQWRFTTKEGRAQFKSLFYRIYINIFGIFLRIPILPMGFSWKWKTFDIWYFGDQVICYWKKGRLRYTSIGCEGNFSSLAEMNKFWDEYFNECAKIAEREDKEYKYRVKNNLCTDLLCSIVGEHKKH